MPATAVDRIPRMNGKLAGTEAAFRTPSISGVDVRIRTRTPDRGQDAPHDRIAPWHRARDDPADNVRGWTMDLIVRNARLSSQPEAPPVDIGVADGRIAAIAPGLQADGPDYDAGGCLTCAGLVET